MQIDVSKIKNDIGQSEKHDIHVALDDFIDPEGKVKWLGSVTGKLTVTNTGESLLVRGEAHVEAFLQCSRCLRNFNFPISVKFEEEYFEQEGPEITNNEYFLTSKDLKTFYYQGDILDLDDLLKQSIQLALPMKPVCNEACRGMCPHCGQDLNEGECQCKTEQADPRWEKLKGLLKE